MLAASRLLGPLVVLTREEIAGLMADLLVSSRAPTGTKPMSAWLEERGVTLGRTCASEIARHYR